MIVIKVFKDDVHVCEVHATKLINKSAQGHNSYLIIDPLGYDVSVSELTDRPVTHLVANLFGEIQRQDDKVRYREEDKELQKKKDTIHLIAFNAIKDKLIGNEITGYSVPPMPALQKSNPDMPSIEVNALWRTMKRELKYYLQYHWLGENYFTDDAVDDDDFDDDEDAYVDKTK